MDIFTLLKQDHAKVNELLEKLSKTTERANVTRDRLFTQVQLELMLHMVAEEKVFYPMLKNEDITEDLTLEAVEEHHLVKVMLNEMAGMEKDSEQWAAKLQVLSELVAHHVEEEEKELFPKAKKVLDKQQTEALAIQVEEEKRSYNKQKSAPMD